MNLERIHWENWARACRCEQGGLVLILVADVGPRILWLGRAGGPNLLYQDATGYAVGSWRMYGGHRLTVAPESPASYEPDHQPCELTLSDDRVTAVAPPAAGGLQREITIGPSLCGSGFEIRHRLRNAGALPVWTAPWAITCLPVGGRLVVDWGSGGPGWRTNMIRFWSRVGDHAARLDSPQWRFDNDALTVEPTGERAKIGLFSDRGRAVFSYATETFIKTALPVAPESCYPDGGCNVEVYTCRDYLEIETLGPLASVPPGGSVVHVEEWTLGSRGR